MANLAKGTILAGTYEIIEEIGAGGGGIAYKGRHLRLQTDVVVKKIKDDVVDRINIRAEADILKNLKHAYIPRIYDFIETEEGIFTVIDFIPGDDLEKAIKKHGPFSQKQVVKWAKQLGEALSYLHSQNPPIIHSDIKPANIMLTANGDICLIDFNISLAIGEAMDSAVGISPGFSPPEQFHDPALYISMSNKTAYGQRNQAANAASDNTDKTEMLGSDASTEVLGGADASTEILGGFSQTVPNANYNVTVPLGSNNMVTPPGSENKTVLLYENKAETVRLFGSDSPVIENDKTEILSGGSTTQNVRYTSTPQTEYIIHMGRGIDARSDVYSLGMTLLYMLTGIEPPLEFDRRVMINETRFNVSEGLELIINRMIALNPADRYKDGTAFLDAINNIHKLDSRYKKAHRTQTVLQLTSLAMFIVGVFIVAFSILSTKNAANSEYNALIDNAEAYIESGDYVAAEALIDEAVALDPDSPDAYKERIYLLYSRGDYETAIAEATAFINSPTLKMALEEKAQAQFASNEQNIGDIYYLLANSYYELGKYTEAVRYIEEAITLNTQNGNYYRDYAIILAKTGRTSEAMSQLDMATSLNIADDSLYLVKGQIAYSSGSYRESVDFYKQSISISGDETLIKRAVLMCSEAYDKLGPDYADENISMLEEYQDQFGQTGSLMVKEYLAKAYMVKAKVDPSYNQKALDIFEAMINSGYSSFQVKENMAVIYGNMGLYDKADEILLALVDEYPGNYEIYKDLAFIEIYKQDALEIIDRDYRQFKIYYDKAVELADTNSDDDELEMLRRAAEDLQNGGWALD